MRKSFVIGIGIAAFVAAAVSLRLHDAPYIAVVTGHRAAATEGLIHKAENGDGFAALLAAQNYSQGVAGTVDREKAADWYLTAVRLGEDRAIVPFIGLAVTREAATPDRCRIATPLLDLLSRTGELGALLALGRYYENGICVEQDFVMAARYYLSAAQVDGRFREWVDTIAGQIPTETVLALTPRVATFDVAQSVARSQFLADAPALR